MKTKKKLIEDYFKTTGYEAPNGTYKISPKLLVEHFYTYLLENEEIKVEVDGGVAYSEDKRVNIIDYDNLRESI